MKEIMKNILSVWFDYWGKGYYPYLLLVAVIYLLVWKRKKEHARQLLAFIGVCLVVFFFPVTAWIIRKCIGPEVYWRVLWILPVVPLIAWAAADFVRSRQGRAVQVVLAVMIMGLIVICGKSVWSAGNYEIVHNYQKVPDNVAQIAGILNSGKGEEEILLAADDHVSAYIRVYDPSIHTAYGRGGKTPVCAEARRFYRQICKEQPNFKKAAKLAKKAGCNFIVLAYQEEQEKKFAKQGYEKIAIVNEYAVYKLTAEN